MRLAFAYGVATGFVLTCFGLALDTLVIHKPHRFEIQANFDGDAFRDRKVAGLLIDPPEFCRSLDRVELDEFDMQDVSGKPVKSLLTVRVICNSKSPFPNPTRVVANVK